jgi:hypothetical protein
VTSYKDRISTAHAWCNQLLFKLITIYNNCIIVKSYKIHRMTIAQRARAVEILVSGSLDSLQHGAFFLSLLKVACHYHRKQTHTECSRYLPLPRVKVVTFLRDKSVMSMSRQTNGAHGCLKSPQKVRYYLKVERLFARRRRTVCVYPTCCFQSDLQRGGK